MSEQNQDKLHEDAQNANPEGTSETENTETNPTEENANSDVDYKTKFSESTREALRLLEENKKKDEEIEKLRKIAEEGKNYDNNSDSLYPGFDTLGDDEKRNLIAYTNSIKSKALEEVYKDPAISHAKKTYNESKWAEAFNTVSAEYPELNESKDEFKSKYFKADNVPSNITDIMKDLAKVYLFDKAKDIGAKKAIEQANRLDTERAKGGDKTPKSTRTLEDWNKLAQENPAKFAKLSKEFNEDFQSGKLK